MCVVQSLESLCIDVGELPPLQIAARETVLHIDAVRFGPCLQTHAAGTALHNNVLSLQREGNVYECLAA